VSEEESEKERERVEKYCSYIYKVEFQDMDLLKLTDILTSCEGSRKPKFPWQPSLLKCILLSKCQHNITLRFVHIIDNKISSLN
jgi:hypothetical protein